MLEAGFDLQKWLTNNFALQKHFKQKENLLCKNHSFAENDSCTFLESQIKFVANDLKSVFGVEWNTQNDEFLFHFSSWIDLARSLETTKRNVLKISASFYDPLGLISLVTAQVLRMLRKTRQSPTKRSTSKRCTILLGKETPFF